MGQVKFSASPVSNYWIGWSPQKADLNYYATLRIKMSLQKLVLRTKSNLLNFVFKTMQRNAGSSSFFWSFRPPFTRTRGESARRAQYQIKSQASFWNTLPDLHAWFPPEQNISGICYLLSVYMSLKAIKKKKKLKKKTTKIMNKLSTVSWGILVYGRQGEECWYAGFTEGIPSTTKAYLHLKEGLQNQNNS